MKIYKSKTLLSIYVQREGGKGKHLRFDPMSDGRGMLKVTDKKLMEDLEKHDGFGKTFILWRSTEDEAKKIEEKASETVALQVESAAVEGSEAMPQRTELMEVETSGKEVAAEEEKVMTFACFDDAREWVHETYGYGLKKLMSKAAVINAAAEKGVKIIIED